MHAKKLIQSYRLMLLSRAIDDMCDALAARGITVPNYHGARGEEAMYAGIGAALRRDDYLLYNYRAFATLLAKGITLGQLMGDLLGTRAGTTAGHGGIMHVHAAELGVVGRNGVFGSKFGIALGLAEEISLHGRSAAVACMFGEAEGNRGGLYEALNIAALRNLPIVFIAENNGYAVAAPTSLLYSTGDMSGAVRGFPMAVSKIDGNDVTAVTQAAVELMGAARDGHGPAFLECVTIRLDPHHARDDQTKYRDAGTLKKAWEGEPLRRAREALTELGWSSDDLEHERLEAAAQVKAATRAALAAPTPALDIVHAHTYYQGTAR